jgi:hypothetical protein
MVTGSCLCGGVAFELDEPLSPIELCHCNKCKKAYGAPFAATLYCRRTAFRWREGEALVTSYDAPLQESPPAYRHSFCARCGSALPLLWDELPIVEVPVASLDDAVEGRPAYQMFESQRSSWLGSTDTLRSYACGAPLREKVVQALL